MFGRGREPKRAVAQRYKAVCAIGNRGILAFFPAVIAANAQLDKSGQQRGQIRQLIVERLLQTDEICLMKSNCVDNKLLAMRLAALAFI